MLRVVVAVAVVCLFLSPINQAQAVSGGGVNFALMPSILGLIFHERSVTPKSQNATYGRYAYIGDVPRFEVQDLEMFVSKMGLTLRVKAWVKPQVISGYEQYLLNRWKKMYDAFRDPKMSFVQIKSVMTALAAARDPGQKAWLLAASKYMDHTLEGYNVDIYAASTKEEYKKAILTALLRSYYFSQDMTIEQGLERVALLNSNPIADPKKSQELFTSHLGPWFTTDIVTRGPNYSGFLTLVYPIAATTAGPFNIPGEGIQYLGIPGSMDAVWWSNKWEHEFGGLPFLMITSYGVAFHGPITNYAPNDVWYLRRGYVSHGCHRMDESDVTELRNILPANIMKLKVKDEKIPIMETEWPDVTDWNNDGKPEVMDVAYYSLPGWFGVTKKQSYEDVAKDFFPENRQKAFWTNQFKKWDGKLESKNTFDTETGVFTGLPIYQIDNMLIKRVGFYGETPIHSFPKRKARVVQYREEGVPLEWMNDALGKYPPAYFNGRP